MSKKITLRTKTRQVWCGRVPIGGGAPVSIQSMTNTYTEDIDATVEQIAALYDAGADIVRVAAPTTNAAKAITVIKNRIEALGNALPIVADIHFDYRIALQAIKAGADKIRINPGNIGGEERIKMVADAAGAAGIPIRIGINSGSIQNDLLELYEKNPAKALAESAFRSIELIRKTEFEDIVVSIKTSDVIYNTEAHKLLAAETNLPLHIGITEAGLGEAGIVKSAVGIGSLLTMGIGDTIRVSLTGNPIQEITAARDILRAVNLLHGQITIISCPTCGRCKADLAAICCTVSDSISEIENRRISSARKRNGLLYDNRNDKAVDSNDIVINRPITVAIMGCAVNGPGEASHADLGVALGPDGGVYFEKGFKIGVVTYDKIAEKIIDGIKRLNHAKSF